MSLCSWETVSQGVSTKAPLVLRLGPTSIVQTHDYRASASNWLRGNENDLSPYVFISSYHLGQFLNLCREPHSIAPSSIHNALGHQEMLCAQGSPTLCPWLLPAQMFCLSLHIYCQGDSVILLCVPNLKVYYPGVAYSYHRTMLGTEKSVVLLCNEYKTFHMIEI